MTIPPREGVRRALTDLFSMTPWPLELAGSFILWHYGGLFSSVVPFSRDWRAVISQIMPGDAWGIGARVLACVLAAMCLLTWLARQRLYQVRIGLAVVGLLVWSVLVYSCLRADVPWMIWRLYLFYLITQSWVAALLYARLRGQTTARDPIGGGA